MIQCRNLNSTPNLALRDPSIWIIKWNCHKLVPLIYFLKIFHLCMKFSLFSSYSTFWNLHSNAQFSFYGALFWLHRWKFPFAWNFNLHLILNVLKSSFYSLLLGVVLWCICNYTARKIFILPESCASFVSQNIIISKN